MKNILSVFVISIILLSACSTLNATYDFDKSANFSEFHTFSFYPWDWKNGFQINEYDKQTILMAIQDNLEDKGYKYVKKGGDMSVSIFLTLKDKTSYEAYTSHYGGWAGYGGGWGYSGFGYGYGYGPGFASTTVSEYNYEEGTLIIDVFNFKEKKLIWQGIGSRQVEPNLEKRDRMLPKNVGQILRPFPKSNK